ncbi:phosphoglycerate mutase [Patescibacteria group bacterium]|nr:phosphoglycerate mutase [Patescibacteria group bacterium]
MKGILVLLDGIGDLPSRVLKGKTPLEAANTPNLDFLAARGEMGLMYPVRPGFIPESDQAVISIFGNELIDSTRGQLEAKGTGLKLTRGDLALRVNFATIDSLKEGNILDRRAGRTLTTAEAEILAKAINKIKLPCEFVFKSTVQHRAALVLRGGFSDNISSNDSTYSEGKMREVNKISNFRALDDEENTQYTVNILNEFLDKVFEVLDKHPINQQRRKKGLSPANFLLIRGAGIEPPKLKFYRKWISVAYMPLEMGFSEISGMNVFSFDYPPLKGYDSYKNLREGLIKACDFSIKVLKKNHKSADYAYIHLKETDLPGHDNKPIEKKLMIEHIDKTFFKFLKDFATSNKIKVVVTGDHSTPCKLKAHSADPVPILFYNDKPPKPKGGITSFFKNANQKIPFYPKKNPLKPENSEEKREKFCEKNAKRGSLGKVLGKELFEKVGFLK